MKLRKLFSFLIAAFIPFVLLAWLGKLLFPYELHPALNPNEFTFPDLRIYFSHVMPLLYIVALLMHILFVAQLFEKFNNGSHQYRKQVLNIGLSVVLVISVVLSTLAWQKEAGVMILFRSICRVFIIQVVYWLLCLISNLIVNKLWGISVKSHISNLTSRI